MGSLLLLGAGGSGGAGIATDPHFANVLLLCGFEDTDGSTSFVDESSYARTLTAIGNGQIDTADFKFGASSYLGDGTTDGVSVPDSADWNFTGEFTIECWFKVDSSELNTQTKGLITHRASSAEHAWSCGYSTTPGGLVNVFSTWRVGGALSTISGTSNLAKNTWHHGAWDRDSGGTIRNYINGTMDGSVSKAGTLDDFAAVVLAIGCYSNTGASAFGWIDEVRITTGVARYASDGGFTVPSAAYPRS